MPIVKKAVKDFHARDRAVTRTLLPLVAIGGGFAVTPATALELGELNAGFVFFAVALLSTLVFGRFMCGWACHLVAYLDLCGWIMKRLGIRPPC